MTTNAPTATADELMAHAAWLRRLARSLVDEAAADDMVQETWAAALAAPPAGDRPLRPWLAAVLRNFVRLGHRRRQRRTAREESAAELAAQDLPSPEALLAQHQARRLVAAAVETLPEPFRATLLLVYAEGLTPSEIARRQGVPAGTVRWRLSRAHELVRQELDSRSAGDRRAWVLLLAELRAPAAPGTPSNQGGLMKTKLILTGVVALAVASGVALVFRPGVARRSESPPPAARPLAAGEGAPPAFSAAPPGEQDPGAAPGTIAGVVRDEGGRPLAGARVAAVPAVSVPDLASGRRPIGPAATSLTDGSGRYRLPGLPPERYGVTVTAAGFAPGHRAGIDLGPRAPRTAEADLVLRRDAVVVQGQVRDAGAGPVAGARVMALILGPDQVGEPDTTRIFVTLADGQGRFQLWLARQGSYGFAADADGYAQARLPIEALLNDVQKDITLRPAAQVSGSVQERGRPAPGALVRLARTDAGGIPFLNTATTDAAGVFAFRGVQPGRYRLWARRGAQAARLSEALLVRDSDLLPGLTLDLKPAGTITGQVRAASGAPVAGAVIWFEREEEAWAQERQATTGPDGRYRIEGVLPAAYRLRAMANCCVPGMAEVDLQARASGEADFVLAPVALVVGRVLAPDGKPAAHARVLASFNDGSSRPLTHRALVADADGSFRLERLAPGPVAVAAEDAALGLAREVRVSVTAGERREVTLSMIPGARAAGRVRWSDGTPAAGVFVAAYQGQGLVWSLARTTTTAADGTFALPALIDKEARLFAAPAPLRAEPTDRAPGPDFLRIVMGDGREGLELVLPRPNARR